MDWNDEMHAQLRVLWDEGLSTAEIGRRMGVSKNAVVSKSHRLKLTARPSPIRRNQYSPGHVPAPSRREVARPAGPTQPPLRTEAPAAPALVPVRLPKAVPVFQGRVTACCWPIGEPGTREFRFCDAAESVPGRPYCLAHCRIAYRQVA